jgi:hypothetical protein
MIENMSSDLSLKDIEKMLKSYGIPVIPPDELEYDEDKILGRGSYGTVFEGIFNDEKVAVK